MVAAEFLTGLGAFKTMFDIAKGLKDTNDAAVRNAAVIELQEKILGAQAQQTALIEQVRQLEEQVAGFETWQAEKSRYELKDLKRGFFAYIPKVGEEGGEPPHALCTNCYQKGVKSILQCNGSQNIHHRAWDCAACGTSTACTSNNMAELIQGTRG